MIATYDINLQASRVRIMMRKFGLLDDPFKLNATFTVAMLLEKFDAISISSQGTYYIAVSLCPKNALLGNKTCPCENPEAIVHSSKPFYLKYANHCENLKELFKFSFTSSEILRAKESERTKNKNQFDFSNTLVISFELMKKINDDLSYDSSDPTFSEGYLRVGICSIELQALHQTSFAEFTTAHFTYPYSAVVTASIFCLLNKVDPPAQTQESSQGKQRALSQPDLAQLKKLAKRQVYCSYIVRKQLRKAAEGQTKLSGSPLISTKSIGSESQDHSAACSPQRQSAASLLGSQKSIEEEQILQKMATYDMKYKELSQIYEDLKLCCKTNCECLSETLCSMAAKIETGGVVDTSSLKKEYESHKINIYNQKISSELHRVEKSVLTRPLTQCISQRREISIEMRESSLTYSPSQQYEAGDSDSEQSTRLESGYEMQKRYQKQISTLKSNNSKHKDYFTPMHKLFNLIPTTITHRFDSCPYLFHSVVRYPRPLIASKEVSPSREGTSRSLFILVHGYQANSHHMEAMKISFKQLFHGSKFLVVDGLNGGTDKDIKIQGRKVAKEIQEYLQNLKKRSNRLYRIVLVGHSMGGIILRAALPHLSKFTKELLHTFISFATPHLGYLNCNSKITGAGIKLIESLTDSTSLRQISNSDNSAIKQTFIYGLAKEGSLAPFKHVLLFSSIEDKYVPWNSARIQVYKQPKGVAGKNTFGGWYMKSPQSFSRFVEEEMVANILGMTSFSHMSRIESVHRFQVDFNMIEGGLDSWIGRSSHVAFLGNQHLLPMVMLGCLKDSIYEELRN